MKIFNFLIFFLSLSVASNAQERLTDYQGEGSALINYLKTIDDKNYLIQIHPNDIVETFEILSATKRKLLNNIQIENIYFADNLNFYKEYLIYEKDGFIYGCNFLTSLTVEIMAIPDEFDRAGFANLNDKKLHIWFIDTSVKTEDYLFDFGSSLQKINRYLYLSDDYGVTYFQDTLSNQYNLIKFNINAQSLDTFPINCIEREIWQRQKNELYFLGCDGQIQKIDLESDNGPTGLGINLGYNDSRYFDVNDSLIITSIYDGYDLYYTYNNSVVRIYSKNDLSLISTHRNAIEGNPTENIRVNKSNVLLYGVSGLSIINMDTDLTSNYPGRYYWNALNIQNSSNSIFHSGYDDGEYYFETIELDSRISNRLDFEYSNYEFNNYQNSLLFEDTLLITFNGFYKQNSEIFILDSKSSTLKNHKEFDNTHVGFKNRTGIHKIGNSIVVDIRDDNLYVYKNDSFSVLSPEPLSHRSSYIIRGGTIMFHTASSKVYKFDGDKLSLLFDPEEFIDLGFGTTTSRRVEDYAEHGDYFFILSASNDMTIINKVNQEYETINNVSGFTATKDFIFYYNSEGLWATDGTNTHFINPVVTTYESLYESDDKFLQTSMGVWEINISGIFTKIHECQDCTYRLISNKESTGALLYFDNAYHHYDNHLEFIESTEPMKFSRPIMTLTDNNEIYIGERYEAPPSIKIRIYDFKNKKFKEDLNSDIYFFIDKNSIITFENKEFFISGFHIGEQSYVSIITLNENGEMEILKEFTSPDSPRVLSSRIGNIAFILVGNKLLTINSEGEINQLSGAVGNSFSRSEALLSGNEILIINDEFYFVATDTIKGKQLYKYKPSQTTASTSFHYDDNILDIYPNPANSFITCKGNDDLLSQASKYSIFSLEGKEIRSEKFTAQISVEGLLPGIYILEIQFNNKLLSKKFVKF